MDIQLDIQTRRLVTMKKHLIISNSQSGWPILRLAPKFQNGSQFSSMAPNSESGSHLQRDKKWFQKSVLAVIPSLLYMADTAKCFAEV